MKIVVLVFAFAVVSASTSLLSAQTAFYFESSPTSWVGQRGATIDITDDDNFSFAVSGSVEASLRISVNNLAVNPPSDMKYWNVTIAAPSGEPMELGKNYLNTDRFRGIGKPQLNVSGNHRGDNMSSGEFQLLELNVDPEGAVDSLALNFVYFGEKNPDNWLTGGVRYNSSVPKSFGVGQHVQVPEPSTGLLLLVGCGSVALRRRRGRR